MMAGAEADTLYITQDCYDKETGSKDKELFHVEGAHHIQTYFVPQYVDKYNRTIMERSAECFRGFADCFKGSTERGIIFGHGLYAPKDARNSKFATEAYELDKNI